MNAEIIAIGSELLTPFRQDTNSLFLTERLNELGVEVRFKTVVGDSLKDLAAVAQIAISRSDIVIFMGGLGPTEDDLTREAVAETLGIELRRDPDIVTALYKRFAARRFTMTDNNKRQADVLAGAEVLHNPNGSAPAQWLATRYQDGERLIMLLPGPPHELKPLFDAECLPRLKRAVPREYIAKRQLKVAMIGESALDARIAPIYTKFPEIQTTILAHAGEVQIHLQSRADSQEEAERRVSVLAEKLEEELEASVFASEGETLEQIVGYYLQMRGETLAVAESCTGGLLAQRITSVAGSSRYFLGGAVVYSNQLKTELAGVSPAIIQEHGAVSKAVALALAEGIRVRTNATLGVGVTGIAGPTGGTPEKPVGLVFIALTDGKLPEVLERRFPGDRERIRLWASMQALDMIRRRLI